MANNFCFPSKTEIADNLAAQADSETVSFKSRGLNDVALKVLLDLLLKNRSTPLTTVDLSYNDLTNASLPLLEDLSSKGYKLKLEHNSFNIEPEHYNQLSPNIRQALQQQTLQPLQLPLQPIQPPNRPQQPPQVFEQPLQQPILSVVIDHSAIGQQLSTLHASLQSLTTEVQTLGNSVTNVVASAKKLTEGFTSHEKAISEQQKTLVDHEYTLQKISKAYERHVETAVLESFEGFERVNQDAERWLKQTGLQCDLILINHKQKKLLIGEVKSHLDKKTYTKAFEQLTTRKIKIETERDVPETEVGENTDGDLSAEGDTNATESSENMSTDGNARTKSKVPFPEAFKQVKEILLLMGCERIDPNIKALIEKQDIYLASPSPSRYVITQKGEKIEK